MNPLIEAAARLSRAVNELRFAPPVTHVYNPLGYAWEIHREYLERYGAAPKRVVYLGMNPGPWGMAQVGVPFGEVSSARDWLKLSGPVNHPANEHPKRPVLGFDCPRSEVSGRRLWGFFAEKFGSPENFFAENFVANYCPLVFMEESGRNRTPDKLPALERAPLTQLCDAHLREVVETLKPEWLIGVGAYARDSAERALAGMTNATGSPIKFGTILHPSPASPAANRGWAEQVEKQLRELRISCEVNLGRPSSAIER